MPVEDGLRQVFGLLDCPVRNSFVTFAASGASVTHIPSAAATIGQGADGRISTVSIRTLSTM
ncbi:hypothetical protein [Sciscionella marina]|uniref:hypothetical protein n=1 Tax=Sciscionella marina TaxID=508770 RepID=UPI0004771053|nr:hypothetical protein [Sciscionella marina]